MRERRQRRSLSCGFTLIEVLLAITITGFVLASATTLIVSISEIWANRQNSHFFGDHVDGVTEFLQARLSEAGTEIALDVANQGRGLTNDSPEEKEDDGPEVRVVVNALEEGIPANQASSNSQSQSQAGLIRTSGMPMIWQDLLDSAPLETLYEFSPARNPPLTRSPRKYTDTRSRCFPLLQARRRSQLSLVSAFTRRDRRREGLTPNPDQ